MEIKNRKQYIKQGKKYLYKRRKHFCIQHEAKKTIFKMLLLQNKKQDKKISNKFNM